MKSHPQGACPDPVEMLRLEGDLTRRLFRLCPDCRATFERPPFNFRFRSADDARPPQPIFPPRHWWSVG